MKIKSILTIIVTLIFLSAMLNFPQFIYAQSTDYMLLFDGIDDYVQIPSVSNLDLTDQITMSVWVNPNVLPDHSVIIAKPGTSPYYYYALKKGENDKWQARLAIEGISYIVNSDDKYSPNKWVHLSATYDGSNIKMYVNGMLQKETVHAIGNISTSEVGLRIGSWSSTEELFKGELNDVRIYEVALSESEIHALYMNQEVTRGLVAEWRFDEGSGSTAKDTSGNGNDGTIIGGATFEEFLRTDIPEFDESLEVFVSIDSYEILSGEAVTKEMEITINGFTKIDVTDISFTDKSEWFTIGKELPMSIHTSPGNTNFKAYIPITLAIPPNEQISHDLGLQVTMIVGGNERIIVAPIIITEKSTNTIPYLIILISIVIAGVVLVLRKIKPFAK